MMMQRRGGERLMMVVDGVRVWKREMELASIRAGRGRKRRRTKNEEMSKLEFAFFV